uniref:Uncharacterized protein n=1 Tax=Sphaerodactylus townsendi TaxID=933632 RepID=A0ACB8GAH6_9SAUR
MIRFHTATFFGMVKEYNEVLKKSLHAYWHMFEIGSDLKKQCLDEFCHQGIGLWAWEKIDIQILDVSILVFWIGLVTNGVSDLRGFLMTFFKFSNLLHTVAR